MTTKVMIAEDNTSVFSCYQNFLSKDKTIEIIGTTDGNSTVEMYKKENPDILILDLGLPQRNGLEILNELTFYEGVNIKCNVIVISGNNTLKGNLCNTRKVFRIMSKPLSLGDLQYAVNELRKEQSFNLFSEIECQNLLLRLKLNPLSKNGRLLTEAIKLCYYDFELLDNMNSLYSALAEKNSCSVLKIKSRLRSIIDTANRFANTSYLNTLFYIEQEDLNKFVSPKHFFNGVILFLKNQKAS